ncbi:fungal-specific transcription factor domain-containing protein [Xylariales sp. AK1849]|nr:fungal-specific transcription factor domain-containing protein [Xylariales sp. AK1849]
MPSSLNDPPVQNVSRSESDKGSDNSPPADGNGDGAPPLSANANVPKPKRLACMICRKRKLKCDGNKPSCSTCTRLGHSCAYDEVRRKSGPKRGYVKALEERLKQVESLLKTGEPVAAPTEAPKTNTNGFENRNPQANASTSFNVTNPSIAIANDRDMDRWHFNGESPQAANMDDFNFASNMSMGMDGMTTLPNNFTWEMIGLGLEEPLPPQETIDELHQIFFEKVHPSLPMIHKYRYLAAMNLAPNQRPPVALRYAIWTLACSITEKYADMKDLFYQRARKYVEGDYIKGYGEHLISVAHCQTHVLLASYEFKMMYFPRAWMSTGSSVRLSQMIGLHRLDGSGLDVKQCLPPPRDWTEREERRRTFWMAFCQDRYASIGTGWPMSVDERDILTNLPSSEDAFEMSRPETALTLAESMSPAGAAKLSSFGGIVLMACLFGRNLIHLHRPDADDRDHDLNGEFWMRHRNMDNILLNTSLCLPGHLKLPSGLGNPNIVFTNMNIHTSTICLHQAAIFKADKNRLPASVSAESKVRCITAANEIASIMRMVSHMDLSAMNPFISFCLYVASRVFVQYLKSRPDDSQTADSLRFLLSAMNALKRKNPLTESFLVQLDVDLEALGTRIPQLKTAFPRSGDNSPNNPVIAAKIRARQMGTKPCDKSDGILAYKDDCDYVRLTGDDGNPVNTPDLVDSNQNSGAAGSSDFEISNWLPGEQQIPTRERNNCPDLGSNSMVPQMMFHPSNTNNRVNPNGVYVETGSSGTNDMSVSPHPESSSTRPTPNSSSASDLRNSTSGRMSGSGRTSFDASPIGGNQTLGTQAEMDAAAAAFFSDASNFGMQTSGTGMTPGRSFVMPDTPGNTFTLPEGWVMPGQGTGMTPVAEGVLRHLMDMPPMDAMDLGWDSGA